MKTYKSKLSRAMFLMLFLLSLSTSILTFGTVENAHAYIRGISRANCFTRNESITWDSPWVYNWYWTNSYHYRLGYYQHGLSTGWQYTWDAVAGHSETAWIDDSWSVYGRHWYWTSITGTREIPSTYTTWCEPWSW